MLITGLNNNQIKLHRTQNGKPFLPKLDENLEKVPQFDFNISHDKDIVILASDASHVGTDVMNIARPCIIFPIYIYITSYNHFTSFYVFCSMISFNRFSNSIISTSSASVFISKINIQCISNSQDGCGTLIKFFELMTRQFHKKEWEYIKFPSSEHLQLQRFYRLWVIIIAFLSKTNFKLNKIFAIYFQKMLYEFSKV